MQLIILSYTDIVALFENVFQNNKTNINNLTKNQKNSCVLIKYMIKYIIVI